MLKICCGSASVQRQKILAELGFHVTKCLPSHINEHDAVGGATNPETIVKRITVAKTNECLANLTEADKKDLDLLVTGDIVVVDANDKILEKPRSKSEALEWFDQYKEQKIFFTVQGLEVTNLKTGRRALGIDWVIGRMKDDVNFDGIDEYLSNSGAMSAAGAIIVESEWFSERLQWIRGEETSVRGLSGTLLKALIYEALQ